MSHPSSSSPPSASPPSPTSRLFSPAAERNRIPIANHLRAFIEDYSAHLRVAQSSLLLLEIASGTGQHAAHLAHEFPSLMIHPSDQTLKGAESVASWAHEAGVGERVASLCELDVRDDPESWQGKSNYDLIYCANMVHIAPWSASEGLFRVAEARLKQGGALIMYGPYRFDGVALSESNLAFDAQLRSRDPQWGIRSVSALDELALQVGLTRIETYALPSHNHLIIYRDTFKRVAL